MKSRTRNNNYTRTTNRQTAARTVLRKKIIVPENAGNDQNGEHADELETDAEHIANLNDKGAQDKTVETPEDAENKDEAA